ncbi:flagellar filament capping protein FliD [Acerihabitans arboris]|uniref:Flagellar hook-associated protein 2 n=1 Tax=Acerihabitans arboris TaxID=2691583 RepID=A0A845SI12_9GAMM|nr:flagellar filament capping protein FliD [Acerihabitans arboris]NDL62594.1 flagellar filament capping protein FliD [Acerihabitans arboris]
MATISSLGVGSNLDLSTLLDTLTTNEEKRLTPITDKQTSYNAKLTAYGTLTSALETFTTATEALTDSSVFTEKVASTHDAFTTEVDADAVSGSYSISVTQLAAAQSLTSSQTFSDTTSLIGTSGSTDRSISIQVGTATAVSVSLTDAQTTLAGVRDAINGAKAGVTASIIQSGDSSYQLVIQSDSTGETSEMNISVTGDDTLNGIIGYSSTEADADSTYTSGMSESVAAQNAKLTVNGTAVERSSNTISDVPQGVTLTLTSTTSSTQNLIIRQSATSSTKAVEDWVSAYNTLLTTFDTLSSYTAVTSGEDQDTSNGALLGDSVLRSVKSQIKNLVSSAQSSDTFQVLNQLGVTLNKDGTLTTDEATLVKNLADNPTAVSDFFVGDGKTTGLATQLSSVVHAFTDDDGTISDASDNIDSILDKLGDQYTQVQNSIDTVVARYKKQFTALDVLVASLNSTSDYLTQQFDAISASSSS